MKRFASILLLLLTAFFPAQATAQPDAKTTVRIHLSRDSQVGAVMIPAGDYKVRVERSQAEGRMVLRMTSDSGKAIDLSVSEESSPKQTSTGQAYTLSGGSRVLSKIWFKGESKVYSVSDTALAQK